MADSFLARIPTLSDAELRHYLDRPLAYKTEAVEAALVELGRRGRAGWCRERSRRLSPR